MFPTGKNDHHKLISKYQTNTLILFLSIKAERKQYLLKHYSIADLIPFVYNILCLPLLLLKKKTYILKKSPQL